MLLSKSEKITVFYREEKAKQAQKQNRRRRDFEKK
jgi:hypothetical protein